MSQPLFILLQKYLSNPATKALSMGSFKITDLQQPTNNNDAATKLYVDNVAAGGGTSTGTLPFLLQRGSGPGAVTVGEFTNPSGDDLQLSAPTTTGKLIFKDIHGVDFDNSPLTQTTTSGTAVSLVSGGNNNVLSIVKNAGDFSGNLITLNNSGNFTNGQRAIDITHGTNDVAINIANSGTGGSLNITQAGAGHAIQINKASGSGATPLLDINNTGTSNIRLCEITNTNTSSTGDNLYLETNATDANAHCLEIVRTGNGNNILSIANGGNNNVVITNATTSGKALQINANQTNGSVGLEINKTGTGNAVAIDNTSSGSVASITSTGGGITFTHSNSGTQNMVNLTRSGGTGGRLLNLTYSNSGSEDVVRIDRTSGGGSGNLINLINNTAGVMVNTSQSGTGVNINATNTASSGSSNNVEFVKSGSGNGGNVFIRNVDSVGASTGIALSILNQGTADCLRIQDEAGDTSLFRVDSDGNVGIGVPTTALTDKFVSNAGTGTTTTQIAQSTTTNTITVSDSSLGTSRILLNTTGMDLAGRSDIILEPSRGTAGAGTTPRIRMTVASGSNNGILLQGNNATAGTNFRYGFTSGSTGETSMNVYSDIATRRVRIGQQDIYTGIPSGVLEITRNTTPHGTTIPHILLNGTNESSNTVMNCNGGRIVNVADPTGPQDVATRAYVLANAGGTPTQIITGSNSVVTAGAGITTNVESLDTYDMLFNSATGVCGMRESVPDVDTYGHIRVANGSQNDTRVMECWSGEGSTNPINVSTTPIAFSIKPLQKTAFVGQFTVSDIRNIGGTTAGILNIWKNSASHGTNSHINFVGADSPISDSSRIINGNNNGKIGGIRFPTLMSNVVTGDALVANSVATYTAGAGATGQLATFSRPIFNTRAISIFRNNQAAGIGPNATLADGYYYMLSSSSSPTGVSLTEYSGNDRCPVTMVALSTVSPATFVQCFWFRLQGQYKVTLKYIIGSAGDTVLSTNYHTLQILQGTGGNAPTAFAPTAQGYYTANYTRVSNTSFNLNFENTFLLNTTNGDYLTFGQSSGLPYDNWNGRSIVQNNLTVIIEYLGPNYA